VILLVLLGRLAAELAIAALWAEFVRLAALLRVRERLEQLADQQLQVFLQLNT